MRGRVATLVVVLMAAMGVGASNARAVAPGAPDPSFGNGGFATLAENFYTAGVGVVVQPWDGAILVTGEERDVLHQGGVIVARYTSQGALDTCYADGSCRRGGVLHIPGMGTQSGSAIALQSDRKLLVGGTLAAKPASGGVSAPGLAVARVDPDGTLDGAFGDGGVATMRICDFATANGVAEQSDGKVVAVGTASCGTSYKLVVARFTRTGEPDGSFGHGGLVELPFGTGGWDVALQPDGRIVVAGHEQLDGGRFRFLVARLRPDGALDPSFGGDGVVDYDAGDSSVAFDIAPQPDGDLIASGTIFDPRGKVFDLTLGTRNVIGVLRLQPDGTPDPAFGENGLSRMSARYGSQAMTQDQNGALIFGSVGATVARMLLPSGQADPAFGGQGVSGFSPPGTAGAACDGVAVLPDGRIVCAGATNQGLRTVLMVALLGGYPPPPAAAVQPQSNGSEAHRHGRHHRRRHLRRRCRIHRRHDRRTGGHHRTRHGRVVHRRCRVFRHEQRKRRHHRRHHHEHHQEGAQ